MAWVTHTRRNMKDQRQIYRLTVDELRGGSDVATGTESIFMLIRLDFRVRLEINPADARTRDDRFTLRGTSGPCSYHQVKTVRDDQVVGDECVDLVFTGLVRNARYELEVDPGHEGSPYVVFKDLPCAEMNLHGGR